MAQHIIDIVSILTYQKSGGLCVGGIQPGDLPIHSIFITKVKKNMWEAPIKLLFLGIWLENLQERVAHRGLTYIIFFKNYLFPWLTLPCILGYYGILSLERPY